MREKKITLLAISTVVLIVDTVNKQTHGQCVRPQEASVCSSMSRTQQNDFSYEHLATAPEQML